MHTALKVDSMSNQTPCSYTLLVLYSCTQIKKCMLKIFHSNHIQPDTTQLAFLNNCPEKCKQVSFPLFQLSKNFDLSGSVSGHTNTTVEENIHSPITFVFTLCYWQHLANLFSADMFKGLRIMFKTDRVPCGAS